LKALIDTRTKYIRFAESILYNTQDAEDVVQDCYIRLLERKERGAILNQEAYMMQAVRNASLDLLRKNRPEELDEQYWENKVRSPDLWQQLMQKEQAAQLRQLMQLLSEKQRTAFYLRDVEGYELSEIEALMGINNEAVRAHISRARKQLRELYNKRS
jgi:RNA polymerase sigma factor (sigma-70 family)